MVGSTGGLWSGDRALRALQLRRREQGGPGAHVGTATQERAALTLGHPAPDAELGPVVEGVGEALGDHRAALADHLGGALRLAAVVPAIIVAALAVELMQVPRAQWLVKLAGVHWYVCVFNMVLLSLPILAALLFGLRFGAPARPMLAGAGAGLLAGSLAASLYIAHCPDDSPIFVAAWFTLAILIATGIGAVSGRRLLRW